jgi:hypothetical protein
MTTPAAERPRTTLAICEIAGLFMFIVGLITGLVGRTTASGVKCGSVLGDSGPFASCSDVLTGPTAWTWVLLIGAVVVVAIGWIVDTQQKQRQLGRQPAAA